MEGFVPFENGTTESWEPIPYLGCGSYDGSDFLSFPARYQQDDIIHCLEQGNLELDNHDTRSLYGFFEDFLYLGLISQMTGGIVLAIDFTRQHLTSFSSHVLCTAGLPSLLSEMIDRGKRLSSAARAQRYKEVKACLEETRRLLRMLANMAPLLEFHGRMLTVLSLLYEQLAAAAGAAYKEGPIYYGEHHGAIELTSGSSMITGKLRAGGWCPREIWRIVKQYNTTYGLYALRLTRERPVKDHSSCTSLVCDAYNVKDDTRYPFLHRDPLPCCSFVSININKIIKILKRTEVPLIRYVTNRFRRARIIISSTKEEDRYVAISHVWSDGMGNPNKNSMPACMLQYIQSLCKTGDGVSLPFWIDTICCPVQPDWATDLAISLMRETYSNAVAVLVVDKWLSGKPMRSLQPEQILLCITLSGWTKRLWTFQEGQLAKQIWVLFADGLIHLNEVANAVRTSLNPRFIALKYYLVHDYIRLQGLNKARPKTRQALVYLTEALKFRSTSVATDEALCLAGTCGVDLAKIVAVGQSQRMQEFWNLLVDIPQSIVFFDCPKLEDAGWRWAPSTLRMPSGLENMFSQLEWDMETEAAVKTANGVKVHFDGLVWCKSLSKKSPLLKIKEDKSIKLSLLDQHGAEYIVHLLTPAFKVWLSRFRGVLEAESQLEAQSDSEELLKLNDSDIVLLGLMAIPDSKPLAIVFPELDRNLINSMGGIGLLGYLDEDVYMSMPFGPTVIGEVSPAPSKVTPIISISLRRLKSSSRTTGQQDIAKEKESDRSGYAYSQSKWVTWEQGDSLPVVLHPKSTWIIG